MPNLAYSLEWHNLASRHLETAAVLLRFLKEHLNPHSPPGTFYPMNESETLRN
jgi:hypothetical protein